MIFLLYFSLYFFGNQITLKPYFFCTNTQSKTMGLLPQVFLHSTFNVVNMLTKCSISSSSFFIIYFFSFSFIFFYSSSFCFSSNCIALSLYLFHLSLSPSISHSQNSLLLYLCFSSFPYFHSHGLNPHYRQPANFTTIGAPSDRHHHHHLFPLSSRSTIHKVL